MAGYRTGGSGAGPRRSMKWPFIVGAAALGLGALALWPRDEPAPPPAPISEPAPPPKPSGPKPTFMAVSTAWAIATNERGNTRQEAIENAQAVCEQRAAARIKTDTYITFPDCTTQGVIDNMGGSPCGVLFTNDTSYNISAAFKTGPDPSTTQQMAKSFPYAQRFDNTVLYCVEKNGQIDPQKLFLK